MKLQFTPSVQSGTQLVLVTRPHTPGIQGKFSGNNSPV